MKTIFTNGQYVLGPYTNVEDKGTYYHADNENIGKHLVEGWTREEVANTYVNPAQVAANNATFNAKQQKLRNAAYVAEADALFFKAQRGEIEQSVWSAKIAEIKARFPYKE